MTRRLLPALTAALVACVSVSACPVLAHAYAARSSQTALATRSRAATPSTARPNRASGTSIAAGMPSLTWSAASSSPVQMSEAAFNLYTFNPQYLRQQVAFSLAAPAHVRVRIAPTGRALPGQTHVRTLDLGVRPAGTVQLSWDGRDNAHRLVPAGAYTYTITATNARGQHQTDTYANLFVTYKRIVISLSRQRLTAYDGSRMVLTTLVTTGNPALPTPTGIFPILAKYHPFTFVSPWPPGSKYYYPPSPVTYAMLFQAQGYYIHDAPWRSVYGPGSNAALGTPGQNYTGSHGCVNVPFPAEQRLFGWAPIGTAVVIVP